MNSDECVTFSGLSQELQLRITSFLDIPSLLNLGICDSRMHELPALSPLWVQQYNKIWPQDSKVDLYGESNRKLCRDLLLKRAHIRLDGAYVSRCLYSRRIQEGASLTDTRTYLQIVYHRLIRFLPNGRAYMLLSEKGSRGSARDAFNDLVLLEKHPEILEKYRKQIHECRWKMLGEDEEGAVVCLTYFDGKLSWSARLLVCHGTSRRQAGARLNWLEYKFWDPFEVADYRRRQLYRERERVNNQLHFANLNGTNADTISDMLFQVERLSDAMRSVRDDPFDDVDHVPEELMKDIKLWPDHFPVIRFGYSKALAYLF
jgi:hypothetical protein